MNPNLQIFLIFMEPELHFADGTYNPILPKP